MMRNEKLDIFRGLAMIWVILVHCLYWLKFFSPVKSFLLIEMPLFFFISGASNIMSSKKNLKDFYITRFQRILIPYWIYGIICIAFLTIQHPSETLKDFIKLVLFWLNPFEFTNSIRYITGALWFVPVYLLIILAFPLFKKIYNNTKYIRYLPFIFLLLFVGILNFFENNGLVLYLAKMFVCYGFFTYLGLYFKEIMEKRRIFPSVTIVTICLLTVIVLITFFGESYNMQYNKFPPNFIFTVFNLGALSILYIFSDIIVNIIKFFSRNTIFNWIYQQYVKHGLTIFLFHPFMFILLNWLNVNWLAEVNSIIAFTVIFLLAIPIAAVIGKCFSWIERIKVISFK